VDMAAAQQELENPIAVDLPAVTSFDYTANSRDILCLCNSEQQRTQWTKKLSDVIITARIEANQRVQKLHARKIEVHRKISVSLAQISSEIKERSLSISNATPPTPNIPTDSTTGNANISANTSTSTSADTSASISGAPVSESSKTPAK